jgi:hypothetical protein
LASDVEYRIHQVIEVCLVVFHACRSLSHLPPHLRKRRASCVTRGVQPSPPGTSIAHCESSTSSRSLVTAHTRLQSSAAPCPSRSWRPSAPSTLSRTRKSTLSACCARRNSCSRPASAGPRTGSPSRACSR